MAHEYRISEDDYVAGLALASRRAPWRRAFPHLMVIVALVACFYTYGDPSQSGLFMISVIVSASLIGLEIVSRALIPRRIRKIYANDKVQRETLSIEFGDAGLHMSSRLHEVTIPWDHVVKWREDDTYILTFSTPVMFQIIPKRLADDGFDIEGLRTRLAGHAGPAK